MKVIGLEEQWSCVIYLEFGQTTLGGSILIGGQRHRFKANYEEKSMGL
jgi:hypothetical protein